MAEKSVFSAVTQSCHLVSLTRAGSWDAALWLSGSLLLGVRVGSPGGIACQEPQQWSVAVVTPGEVVVCWGASVGKSACNESECWCNGCLSSVRHPSVYLERAKLLSGVMWQSQVFLYKPWRFKATCQLPAGHTVSWSMQSSTLTTLRSVTVTEAVKGCVLLLKYLNHLQNAFAVISVVISLVVSYW